MNSLWRTRCQKLSRLKQTVEICAPKGFPVVDVRGHGIHRSHERGSNGLAPLESVWLVAHRCLASVGFSRLKRCLGDGAGASLVLD